MRRSAKTIANLVEHIRKCERRYGVLKRWSIGVPDGELHDELCFLARAIVTTRIMLVHGVNVRDAIKMEQGEQL